MSTTKRTELRPGAGVGRRLWFYGFVGSLGLAMLGGATPPSAQPTATPPPPQPMGQDAAPAAASPMDEPLRLVAEARQAYAGVRDYSCVLVKREKMEGQPLVDNVVTMKVRAQPFSVYLRWQEPKALAGQEVAYVEGMNGGKMRVHSSGLLGTFGFVSLDPDDPRARQTSRHSITEAGVGNLLARLARGWENERRLNTSQVRIADYEYNKRLCTRVEVIRPSNPGGQFPFSRSVVYFDKETHLPIRVECYDWPRRPGDPAEAVEVYSYVNMRLNVGLGDEVFNH
jgi:hypothetical protein